MSTPTPNPYDPSMGPVRPTRAELAAALVRAAEGEPLLADRPVAEVYWGLQRVDLLSGWQLWPWWLPDQQLGALHQARSPEGSPWSYGCDRWPDWNAGPDAVVLDPLRHLITPEQRERLRLRLLSCSCWPEPDRPPQPEPPLLSEIFPAEDCWELMPS